MENKIETNSKNFKPRINLNHNMYLSQGLPGTNPGSGQGGAWTRDLQISSPAPWPLGHDASW